MITKTIGFRNMEVISDLDNSSTGRMEGPKPVWGGFRRAEEKKN